MKIVNLHFLTIIHDQQMYKNDINIMISLFHIALFGGNQ